jgi:hypothetical protein
VSTPIRDYPPDDILRDELREVLDAELARLPARQRGPVVLCELEGLPRPEAARRLGIPEGTLSSRLARAKARLRDRLASRGVALPAAALSVILAREARAAIVPVSLLESTVEAAMLVVAGPTALVAAAVSAPAASLCEGVIKTMLVAKLKGFALAAGTMAAVVSGAVVLAQSRSQGPGPGDSPKPAEARFDGRGPRHGARGVPSADTGADPDERSVVERKLDQVLDELRRISSAGDLRASRPMGGYPGAFPGGLSTTPAPTQPAGLPELPRAVGAPAGAAGRPVLGPAAEPPDARPLSDRMQAVEEQVRGILQRLERVEAQLKSLDERVRGQREQLGSGPATR